MNIGNRQAFLKAHWGAIAAMDFFSIEVLESRVVGGLSNGTLPWQPGISRNYSRSWVG